MLQSLPLDNQTHCVAALQLMLRRGQTTEAASCGQHILTARPDFRDVFLLILPLFIKLRQFDDLLQLSQLVAAQCPSFLPAWQAHLQCLRYLQQHSSGLSLSACLLKQFPEEAKLWLQRAVLLKDIGDTTEALQHLQRAITLQPALYEAYWLRADLLKAPSAEDIALMHHQLATCSDDNGRAQLHYALARALEQLQHYDDSFSQLQLGAMAKKRYLHYNHQAELAEYQDIIEQFSQPVAGHTAVPGHTIADEKTPIFICGLPRSGTTLVEHILSSHPMVTAGDELYELAKATELSLNIQQRQQRFPLWVSSVTTAQWQQIGQQYLSLTRRLQKNTYFTDKMPLNLKAIGIIRFALPQARIIYCQRHPMDTLFSCYKQLFADGIAFSYDLDQLADIYIAQHQLMAHWRKIFPGQIYTVTYEKLVQQQLQQTNALLNFVGLPWSDSCMQFHQNQRAVFTVSNSQVRQPMFHSSIGRWRHYQKQLQPLTQRLQPYIEQYQAALCSN